MLTYLSEPRELLNLRAGGARDQAVLAASRRCHGRARETTSVAAGVSELGAASASHGAVATDSELVGHSVRAGAAPGCRCAERAA